MSFTFADMVTAVETYPDTFVTIEIVDLDFPGSVFNVNEIGTFAIEVTNAGPLHLDNVTVKVTGLSGVLVKNTGAAAPFVTEFVSGEFDRVPAHQPNAPTRHPGSLFSFKAPANALSSRDLIKVTLEGWNITNLDHILLSHSDPVDSVGATFASAVRAL